MTLPYAIAFARLKAVALALGLGLGLAAAPALSQSLALEPTDPDYQGQIWAWDVDDASRPFLPGATLRVQGQNFKPGQTVMFSRGLIPFLPDPLVADAEGRIDTTMTIPDDAPTGTHPVVLSTTNPYHAEIIDFKISPDLPPAGVDAFALARTKLVPGLYQAARSATDGAIFVTAADGYPPITSSEILKLDPASLEVLDRATPPGGADGGLYAVYGLGVDDANGTVWVTNTRHDTVAVYAQDDLRLLKQFEPGLIPHPRDVVTVNGKVYVSAVGAPGIYVFDGAALEPDGMITILTANSRVPFSPASLQVDPDSGRLFTVNLTVPEVAIIDTAARKVQKVIPVPGALGAIGVAYDAVTGRIFVAAQGSDELVILDEDSGAVLNRLAIGAGPLSVAFDPSARLAWVANRGAGTATAVDPDGAIQANLKIGPQPNHVIFDGTGDVYVVNKGRDPADPAADGIVRIHRTE